MEGVVAEVHKGVKSYWNRRGYTRLNNNGSRRKRSNLSREELPAAAAAESYSSSSLRRRRFWKIKLTPRRLKLKFRRFSLKKLCIKLRDGYVNMMMKLANSRFINGGSYAGGYPGEGVVGFGAKPLKEYDEKMIIEIYKSLVLAHGNVPLDASKVVSRRVAVTSSSSS